MQSVAFKKAVSLHTGRLQLTEDQAAVRADRLQKVADGLFDIISPVQFKAGEVFGIETIPKPWRAFLVQNEAPPKHPQPVHPKPEKAKPKRKTAKRKGERK